MNILACFILVTKTFTFCGVSWKTFDNFDPRSGNLFSSEMVKEASGGVSLICKAEKKDSMLTLYSAGIISQRTFYYGTFVFDVEGGLTDLVHSCFAPFLYDYSSGEYEVDIEFSRWGNPSNFPGNYGIIRQYGKWNKPDSVIRNVQKFNFSLRGRRKLTRHLIRWYPDSLVFESYSISRKRLRPLYRWKVTEKQLIPSKPLNVEVYLWWPSKPDRASTCEVKLVRFEYIKPDSSFYKNFLPSASQIPEIGK